MLLTSAQALRAELGFDDMADINRAIEMALHASESIIAAALRTSFERKSNVDRFFVERPSYSRHPAYKTELLLSNGFVSGPVVVSADQLGDISSAFELSAEKGVLVNWTTNFSHNLLEVTYTSGFEAEMTTDPTPVATGSYVLSQVPPWLSQATKLKALLLIAKLPAITEAGIELDVKTLDMQYAAIINRHIRYAPASILPG